MRVAHDWAAMHSNVVQVAAVQKRGCALAAAKGVAEGVVVNRPGPSGACLCGDDKYMQMKLGMLTLLVHTSDKR